MSESMSRRIRAVFNTFNFWSIVLYNILFLNSLDFATLVAKRLLLKGKCVWLNNRLTYSHCFLKDSVANTSIVYSNLVLK